MNRLSRADRVQILRALVEGNSIRATSRISGTAKGTVLKLLTDVGKVCAAYQDDTLTGLTSQRIQCDEIWSFVGAKAKNVSPDHEGFVGDVWTWVALDADTKLCVYWTIGDRSTDTGTEFMMGVAKRLGNRVQLTTDGHKPYFYAVEEAFEGEVDYAQLIKVYGEPVNAEKRYSPASCTGTKTNTVMGHPDANHINTSYVERQNLTMRMSMRRFTRLTNAFSKKVENLAYAVALHFQYYNWARPHQSLDGWTPAMAAGIADHRWEIEEIVELLEDRENAVTESSR